MRKTKDVEAMSKRNGILFYSNKDPMIGYVAERDENGKIKCDKTFVLFEKYKNLKNYQEENKGKAYIRTKNVILIDIILTVIAICTKNIWYIAATIYFSITISSDVCVFCKMMYEMKSKKGKERAHARYHAAEHIVINAYYKLQRVPTIEETKESSRFSKNCGSREIICRIWTYSLASLEMAFIASKSAIVYFVIFIGTIYFSNLAKRKGWLRFLQIFITTSPSDEEIEVAVEGIKYFEKMEEQLSKESYYMEIADITEKIKNELQL